MRYLGRTDPGTEASADDPDTASEIRPRLRSGLPLSSEGDAEAVDEPSRSAGAGLSIGASAGSAAGRPHRMEPSDENPGHREGVRTVKVLSKPENFRLMRLSEEEEFLLDALVDRILRSIKNDPDFKLLFEAALRYKKEREDDLEDELIEDD